MSRLHAVVASIVVFGIGAVSSCFAHDTMKADHGGQVVMSGETQFELVSSSATATLYVKEDDEPVDSTTMTAKLTYTVAGKKQDVVLTPAGSNKFEAQDAKLPKGTSVSIVLVNKATQARTFATITTR